MAKLRGYKTFIFGVLIMATPLLDYINNQDVYSMFLSNPEHQKLAAVVVGALLIVLRFLTTTPIFQKNIPTEIVPVVPVVPVDGGETIGLPVDTSKTPVPSDEMKEVLDK